MPPSDPRRPILPYESARPKRRMKLRLSYSTASCALGVAAMFLIFIAIALNMFAPWHREEDADYPLEIGIALVGIAFMMWAVGAIFAVVAVVRRGERSPWSTVAAMLHGVLAIAWLILLLMAV